MQPAVLVRLHPAGPWRFGSSDGASTRLDALFRSDRLYSALTQAAAQLGFLEEWLDATARTESPALTLSSLFPFQGDTLFVTPPAAFWPPPSGQLTSPSPVFLTKVRWTAATFVPAALVETILTGQKVLADQWVADADSGCLLRRDRPSTVPFRTVLRTGAAVDRLTKTSAQPHTFAGIEFEQGAGLWTVASFADETAAATWSDRLKGLFRLLADTGFGGRRTSGWGQVSALHFDDGRWPDILFPKTARALNRSITERSSSGNSRFWLLSVFSPQDAGQIDWTGGDYRFVERQTRTGRRVRLVAEGSVLSAAASPLGRAIDVAAEGASHPVYRSGHAVTLEIPELPESITLDATPAEPLPEEVPSPEPSDETVTEITEPEPPSPETAPVAGEQAPEPSEEEKDGNAV